MAIARFRASVPFLNPVPFCQKPDDTRKVLLNKRNTERSMTIIKRHRRRLANGEERTYIYEIDGPASRPIGTVDGSVSPTPYREQKKRRISAALQANSSLLVVGEPGCGKTTLGELVALELEQIGFLVARIDPATAKQTLVQIALQLGVDMETLEGKMLTTEGLKEAIAEFLSSAIAFLICDDAHRLQLGMRCWLEKLLADGQPMLLLANHPPARDIFLKLPRIELEPLSERQIREIMESAAAELGLVLSNSKLAQLQERCLGNPMLAKRVIREEYLGLDATHPDHTQWIDGTPLVLAGLMLLVIIRFLGLGFNSTSLYLIGGMITVGVGVARVLIYSLPRKSGRLGQ